MVGVITFGGQNSYCVEREEATLEKTIVYTGSDKATKDLVMNTNDLCEKTKWLFRNTYISVDFIHKFFDNAKLLYSYIKDNVQNGTLTKDINNITTKVNIFRKVAELLSDIDIELGSNPRNDDQDCVNFYKNFVKQLLNNIEDTTEKIYSIKDYEKYNFSEINKLFTKYSNQLYLYNKILEIYEICRTLKFYKKLNNDEIVCSTVKDAKELINKILYEDMRKNDNEVNYGHYNKLLDGFIESLQLHQQNVKHKTIWDELLEELQEYINFKKEHSGTDMPMKYLLSMQDFTDC